MEGPSSGLPEMRKRLRERPTPNTGYNSSEEEDGSADSSLSGDNYPGDL